VIMHYHGTMSDGTTVLTIDIRVYRYRYVGSGLNTFRITTSVLERDCCILCRLKANVVHTEAVKLMAARLTNGKHTLTHMWQSALSTERLTATVPEFQT
jgi:hypothetical protein